MNGDGKLDLAYFRSIPNSQQEGLMWMAGNGDGTFRAGVDTGLTMAGNYPSVALADFNGDGAAEVVQPWGQTGFTVSINDGTGSFTLHDNYGPVPGPGFTGLFATGDV